MNSIIKHTAILTVDEYKEYNTEWREYVKSLSIGATFGDSMLSNYQTSCEIKFLKFEDWLLKKLRDDLNMSIEEIHVIHSTEVSTKVSTKHL